MTDLKLPMSKGSGLQYQCLIVNCCGGHHPRHLHIPEGAAGLSVSWM